MQQLERTLGTRHAVVIGLSSMIGAGAFVSLGGAYVYAGAFLPLAIFIALVVAFANAASTAQLSAQYPTSGGTYVFGRKQLGPWWGFVAGWGFVTGKIASCAAMALVIAAYLLELARALGGFGTGSDGTAGSPGSDGTSVGGSAGEAPGALDAGGAGVLGIPGAVEAWWLPALAIGAIAVVTAINLMGITRTTRVATVLVTIALTALLGTAGRLAYALIAGDISGGAALTEGATQVAGGWAAAASGILHAAALMFFAFAGYARVATMGEEVRKPEKTIPRAIMTALGIVAALYLLLGIILSLVLNASGSAQGEQGAVGPENVYPAAHGAHLARLLTAPFAYALDAAGASRGWIILLSIGAVAAASGALLALVAGISRTMLAMARERDLSASLSTLSGKTPVPRRAQLVAAIPMIALVILAGTVGSIEFSAFGVLAYYFVANAAAWTQAPPYRRWPRALHVVGALGCVALVASLTWEIIVAGLGIFAVGIAGRALLRRS